MTVENGEWVMHGLKRGDPDRLASAEALLAYVDGAGLLPLFRNDIPGFSVEERTAAEDWWCGDGRIDPWEWRAVLARSGKVAYGKFFDKKAGFVSLKLFPAFMNARRDGYPFDALWDDEKATFREKKVMDCLNENGPLLSAVLKEKAGFGKGGEKNFEGTVTGLMQKSYIVISDFRRRQNRQGLPYGWAVAEYSTPEAVWGEGFLSPGYDRAPAEDRAALLRLLKQRYPGVCEQALLKYI